MRFTKLRQNYLRSYVKGRGGFLMTFFINFFFVLICSSELLAQSLLRRLIVLQFLYKIHFLTLKSLRRGREQHVQRYLHSKQGFRQSLRTAPPYTCSLIGIMVITLLHKIITVIIVLKIALICKIIKSTSI